jgi:ferredoxin
MNAKELAGLIHKTLPESDFLSVDESKCEGCGDCVVVCPVFIWSVDAGKAVLPDDYRERCLECGACWQVCPREAIAFDFPESGTGIIVFYG